jgi:glycine oxidase
MPAQGGVYLHNRNPQAADVVVIGGGVIGLTVAWYACRHGLDVIVLDRHELGHATSYVAAGMLGPTAEVTPGEEPLLELGLTSARAYPAFVAELTRASGTPDIGYRECGTLLVARDRDDVESLQRELELRRRFGLRVERLRASEARRREPALAPTLRLALDVPEDHAIDPRRLTAALSAALTTAGGRLAPWTRAAALELQRGRVCGVQLEDGTRLTAARVVVAAGAWCDEIDGIPPQARVPLRPVKGQILRLHDPAGPGLLDRVVRMSSGGYIVPRGDGRYVIGATMEERGFDTSFTAGAAFELLRDAGELVPGISELVIDELSVGLRPGTPDNLPVIGATEVPGLLWASGHRRNGILLAPITAQLVTEALLGEPRSELAQAFAPGRFSRAPLGSAA